MQGLRALGWWAGMALAVVAAGAGGAVIGTNTPAQSLTRERIEPLPVRERGAWLEYLQRSERQRRADQDFFAAELKRSGLPAPIEPPHGFSARSIPLDREAAWYSSAEARHIADVIVSFQTPAGGWGKNLDMSGEARRAGERFGPNNLSRFLEPGDYDTPRDPDWNYIGTIDNDATTTQLRFLAKAAGAPGAKDGSAYAASFKRGILYLLQAQFPNGGWPQVWPLEGGYHDAITYNDDAMTQVVDLLWHTAEGRDEYGFVPQALRKKARASFERGIRCILATQIRDRGVLTVWPQQDDPLTMQPESARNFEPPAECASESAAILLLLMDDLPRATMAERTSIDSAVAWLRKTAIYGEAWTRTPDGRELVATSGGGPLWARFYEIGTERPIFVDRDKTIHDRVSELSRERRNGYAWYSAEPQAALDRFAEWKQAQR
ncbi:MAG TPA: pectate lyase [Acidobacteriaceae bacterium]|jgi:PelA/Pel-15E family pectate lyase|nr:pectate lyase [Acidobacteriaceae bacterium]